MKATHVEGNGNKTQRQTQNTNNIIKQIKQKPHNNNITNNTTPHNTKST